MGEHIAFLSHQSDDKRVARAVGRFLAIQDIEPILDEWAFQRGQSLIAEIERNISRSTCFVLFWSSSASRSWYVQFEDEIAAALHVKNPDYQIQVVRLDRTPLSARHSFAIYHDWSRGRHGTKTFKGHLERLRRAIIGLPDADAPPAGHKQSEVALLLETEKSLRWDLNMAWQELRNWRYHSPDNRDQIEIFEDDVREYERRLREVRKQLRAFGYSTLD